MPSSTGSIGLQKGKIRSHPRCTNLRFQIQTGLWNTNRTDFLRSADGSHLDGVMARAYAARMCDWNEAFPVEMALRGNQIRLPRARDVERSFESIFDALRG